MAKKSQIAKSKKIERTVAVFAERRAVLKEIIRSPKSSDEDRDEAMLKLQKMPRDASKTRVRSRCLLTGRPRGFYQKFGLCRIKLREKALSGDLPGVTKASW